MNPREAEILHKIFNPFWDNSNRGRQTAPPHFARNRAKGRAVQVIHVGVGEQDGMHWRKVSDAKARTTLTPKHDKPGGKDGIDEESFAGRLN